MKTILCYGDSNTWGYNPETKDRFSIDIRWPGKLRNILGPDYFIIEEGLNGRTTVWDDPIEGDKNGKKYLAPCLETHKPIDLVIIMLGTNDLKKGFSLTPFDIAQGMGVLVKMIQTSMSGSNQTAPEVLVLIPPPLGKLTEFAQMFLDGEEKSKELAIEYKKVIKEYKCHYIETSKIIASSDIDGLHFNKENHHKLALNISEFVRKIFF
jgi:lysophospholipase L1-like esterase